MLNKQMLYVWFISLRPKTLPLACCGIMTGTALAIAYGAQINMGIFLFSLLTAILLQISSNLANDYGDMEKCSDTERRAGPNRECNVG